MPPEDGYYSHMIDFLLSERQEQMLERYAEKLDCHLHIDLSVHYNYS